jgi:predicted ArsR family transcriptional regulator
MIFYYISMAGNNKNKNIPKTGRIGRFAKIVEKSTKADVYLRIMEDSDVYNSFKPEQKAQWWKTAVEKLEKEVGTSAAVEVMQTCGTKCCGAGQRKTARKMMNESSSIEEFLEKLSVYGVKDGELEYNLVDSNTIIAKHNRCFCGQVKKSKELFINNTYCQCSVEFNKTFFEAALEKAVDVKLKQSILNGDEFCEFEVKIQN